MQHILVTGDADVDLPNNHYVALTTCYFRRPWKELFRLSW